MSLLRDAQLAGERTEAALERLCAQVPECRAVLFELHLGTEHLGDADVALRLAPAEMERALTDEPALADWRHLAILAPSKGWLELDSVRPEGPLSVFAQFSGRLHPSELRRGLRRLGAPPLPGNHGWPKHLGVLHGRDRREVRVVLADLDVEGVAASWGLPSAAPTEAPGARQLAVGLDVDGLQSRHGVEVLVQAPEALRQLALTDAQRRVIEGWMRLQGGHISHIKRVAPSGELKIYLGLRL